MLEFVNSESVNIYENDEFIKSEYYKIQYGLDGTEDNKVDDMIFILIGDTYPGILTINNDTLILDHSFMDLDKQFYVRKGK